MERTSSTHARTEVTEFLQMTPKYVGGAEHITAGDDSWKVLTSECAACGQWLASKCGSSEDDDMSVDVCSSDVFGESYWAESRRGVLC